MADGIDNAENVSDAQVPGSEPAQVEATPEATAGPGDAPATDGDEPKGEQPGGKKQIGPRIAELTAKRRDAERRAERAEELAKSLAELLKGKGAGEPARPAAPAADDRGPQQSDYRTYEEYLDARADWRAERKFSELQAKASGELTKRVAEQGQAERQASFHRALDEQGATVEGFGEAAEVVFGDEQFPISRPMADYLMDAADHKAAMVKWLAENRTEAARIYSLPPVAAAKELAKVDAQLGQKPTPRTTTAPEPVPSVRPGGATVSDPMRMSTSDYIEHRRKQMAARH